jgi:hypothetical protein
MYRDVLKVEFPPVWTSVTRAVAIRHDLVHRNGKTKDGKIHRLDADQFHELMVIVESFVNALQASLDKETPPNAKS